MLVMIEHFAYGLGKTFITGYYGVDLFFVISGFLITGILYKSTAPFWTSYKKFIGRRTLRIFPIYYLTLFILLLAGNVLVKKYLVFCLTYTYNFAVIYYMIENSQISHFWSLCIEEQFYVVWPFIMLALRPYPKETIIFLISLIAVCYLQLAFDIFPMISHYNEVSIIPKAHSLGMGALGAVLLKENKIPKKILELKWVEYLAFGLLLFFLTYHNFYKAIALPIISLYLILKGTHKGFSINWINRFLNNKKVVYIGTISYGIYVYHQPIAYYFTEQIFDPYFWKKIDWQHIGVLSKMRYSSWIIKLPLYTLITIGVAALSYRFIESPILKLKDRWFSYEKN